MKTRSHFLLVLPILLLLNSCAVFQKQENLVPLIGPATQMAAVGLLDAAQTPEERAFRAKILVKIASALRTIPQEKPTEVEVRNRILATLEAYGKSNHFVILANTLSTYYARAVSRVPDDLSKVTQVLAEIAKGLEEASRAPAPEPALPTP